MKLVKFLIVMFLLLPSCVSAATFAEKSKSAILLEASTGEIVFEKNSHERYAPASMTNVMNTMF